LNVLKMPKAVTLRQADRRTIARFKLISHYNPSDGSFSLLFDSFAGRIDYSAEKPII